MSIWEFYWGVLWRVPWLILESFAGVEGWIAVIAFATMFFNPEIGRKWAAWHTFNRRWAIVPVVGYFLLLLLQSNYAAFLELKNGYEGKLAEANAASTTANSEVDRVNTLMKQLTIENAALHNNAPVLTDAQARIEAIREQFLAHLEKAPSKETFTPELGAEWYAEAVAMKELTVSDDSNLFFMFFSKDSKGHDDYDAFLDTKGGFRGIAINLTEKDLRNNSRDSQN